MPNSRIVPQAFVVLVSQIFIGILGLLILAICSKTSFIKAWMVGWLIAVVPTYYMYRRVFKYFGAQAAKTMVKALYSAAAVKFILTALLFAAAWKLPNMNPLVVLLGYLLTQCGYGLGPLLWDMRMTQSLLKEL